jgi:putative transposase
MGDTSLGWALPERRCPMPWRSLSPMDGKIRFIGDYLDGFYGFAELCERHGISRKTGYKWVDRYNEYGAKGLEEQSRSPRARPRQTPAATEEAIVEVRRHHPDWGAKKILRVLRGRSDIHELPKLTATSDILKRNGCIEERKRRVRRAHPGKPTTVANEPNHMWTADFKGEFKMRNKDYCYPLTIADACSRYLLRCEGLRRPTLLASKRVFADAFEEYGLPEIIRTDNGTPFASNALGRLSRLSVWWVRLGIFPELIEPSSPQQNGRHERMHKTLKAATTRPPERNLREQQARFDTFQQEFNEERPHEALGQETPSSQYRESPRAMPSKLSELVYPSHYEARLVSANGGIRWKHVRVPVSHVLIGETIGLEEVADGKWDVWFGPVWLGRLREDLMRIVDDRGRYFRRKVLPMSPE